ncbi:MAG: c-type cytochrome [Anaerolineaceae bacterium]|nr:c-type cytochrome [Anaerolineaceae bacterium]
MRWARLFFAACLLVSVALGLVAASDTLTTRPMSFSAGNGLAVWYANGCEGCHTLYGQGAAFAPDLTQIYNLRGVDYLREFLANPSAFYPDQRHMPVFGLTVSETDNLLAFLQWVGEQDTAETWPPRLLQVRGGVGLDSGGVSDTTRGTIPEDPVGRGEYWFKRPPAICATCHALTPDVVIVGPSLAGVATRAGTRIPGMSAEAYFRQSILDPSAYVVEGFEDVMMKNFGQQLSADQINDIIAYLMTLE